LDDCDKRTKIFKLSRYRHRNFTNKVPGSMSFSPKSTKAVLQGMILPPELIKECERIATDSIPNSSLSLR